MKMLALPRGATLVVIVANLLACADAASFSISFPNGDLSRTIRFTDNDDLYAIAEQACVRDGDRSAEPPPPTGFTAVCCTDTDAADDRRLLALTTCTAALAGAMRSLASLPPPDSSAVDATAMDGAAVDTLRIATRGRTVVIGTGSGRCGTLSLRNLLHAQRGAEISHERVAYPDAHAMAPRWTPPPAAGYRANARA